MPDTIAATSQALPPHVAGGAYHPLNHQPEPCIIMLDLDAVSTVPLILPPAAPPSASPDYLRGMLAAYEICMARPTAYAYSVAGDIRIAMGVPRYRLMIRFGARREHWRETATSLDADVLAAIAEKNYPGHPMRVEIIDESRG